jgi:hypothetical protein
MSNITVPTPADARSVFDRGRAATNKVRLQVEIARVRAQIAVDQAESLRPSRLAYSSHPVSDPRGVGSQVAAVRRIRKGSR